MKRRILSIITALALCLSLCPTWALAAEADPSLCKHHPKHTEDCGYTAPTEGHDCGHRHTAECYTKGVLPDADGGDYYEIGGDTENLLNCQHSHNSACGYVQADPGAPCGYVCRICPIEDLIAALPEQVTEDNADDVRAQLDHILDLYRELDEGEQEEIDLSRIYALQGALEAANDPAPAAADEVKYQVAAWNSTEGKVSYSEAVVTDYTLVVDSATAVTWNAGWYVVNTSVTIDQPITVTGAVNLILADGCTLNAEKGIVVETGNSLTIYAQSGGTGTLTATGTTDSSNNASAGIGGGTSSVDSGAITIHGGAINATGGSTDSIGYGGAGIGGGTPNYGNGGSSGAITIYGGTVTANSGEGGLTGAGIGGGGGEEGGTSSNITIYGGSVTAASIDTSTGGAGIGGGSGFTRGGGDSNIQIHGGTVNATGGYMGAGIGGGADSAGTSGNGTVTISGGTVTAVGGRYAAGIGGGGGYSSKYSSCTGGTGSVTISGGIVDATGGAGNSSGNYAGDPIGNGGNAGDTAATVSKTNAIVFENSAGTVCGAVTLDGSYTVPGDYTLNIPVGASLSGSGTLSGGSAFTTENLTEDMISVPEDWHYTGEDRTADIRTKLSGELDKGITICGQTFMVSGWTLAVAKTDDLHYTATYTNNSDNTKTVQKTITLLQSGTDLTSEGKVLTYNGSEETTSFSAGDTITVRATPTATGAAPATAAMLTASLDAPSEGQMVVYVGTTQVSVPADKGEDGSYTMTVSASDVLLAAGGPGTEIPLTARFTANDNMADGAGTVTVSITAAAKAERDGNVIDYFGVSDFEGINGAFFKDAYAGATVALLDDITPASDSTTGKACSTAVNITCTLDLAGHNFTSTDIAIYVLPEGNLTIQDSSTGKTGTVSSIKSDGTLKLYGGTFGKIETAYTLSSLLAENCAYYSGSTPILLSELEGKTELTGPVTVQECQHTGVEATNNGDGTHSVNCPYCGFENAAEPHSFNETGYCPACRLQAAAKVEKSGSDTVYVEASGLDAAFADSGNAGAAFTLLADVERTANLIIKINCTLDLSGHTIHFTGEVVLGILGGVTATIRDQSQDHRGQVISEQSNVLAVLGTVTLEGGTFTSNGKDSRGVYVNSDGASLFVTGEHVTIRNTGGGYGLAVNNAQSLQLSAGTYSGAKAIYSSMPISDMLAHTDNTRYAFFQNDIPVTKASAWVDGTISDVPLDTPDAWLSGTVTVRECDHTGVEVQDLGGGKHGLDCPYCGYHSEHTTTLTATVSGNTVTFRGGCDSCDYRAENLATAAFTIPKLTYGQTGQTVSCTWEHPNGYALMVQIDSGEELQIDVSDTQVSLSLKQLFGSQEINAGNYQLHVYCRSYADVTSNVCSLPVTVEKAPLTPSITGTATKTYDGTTAAPEGLEIALTGLVEGDNVTASAFFAYNSENVNEANAITATNITLGGADAGNYRLTSDSASIEGTITKADQAAPAAPAATEENIKDTSITLTIIANAEYSKDGTNWQASPTFTGLDPNRAYTFYARLKEDGNHNASPSSTASITTRKMMLGNATVTVSGSYTYTGAAQTPAVAVVKNGKTLTAGTDYTVSYANNTNAGTATVTITGMGDYEGTNSTTFTIQRKTLTVAGAIAAGRPYNGTNTVTITGVTLDGIVGSDAVSVDTADLTGTLNGSNVGSYTAVTLPALTLTGEKADNYTLTRPAGAVSTSVTISKADAPTAKGGAMTVSNDLERTYSYSLDQLLPVLTGGQTFGTVTYSLGTVSLLGDYYTANAAVTGDKLSLPINEVVTNDEKVIGTVEITISSTNFKDMKATITISSVEKIVPEGTPTASPNTITYGQSISAVTLSGQMSDGTGRVDGRFTWDNPNATPDAGTYQAAWTFIPTDTGRYTTATGTVTITVRKATPSLSLTPSPATLPNGGTVTLTLSGLPDRGSATVTCSDANITVTKGSGNTWTADLPAGGASYTFTASYSGDGNHNGATANCTVSVEKITPTLSLTANPTSLHGGGTVTLTLSGLPAGGTATVTCSGGITVTAGAGNTWTATLPNNTATYTFTASYAGNASYNAASASCTVEAIEVTVLPNPPAAEDGKQYQVVMEDGISEVPAGLQSIETLNTPEKLETAMKTAITQANSGVPQDNTAVYDVELQISTNGGATWTKATAANFPANGLTVTLPYPAGTNSSYTFTVVHMFTTSDFGKTPGDTETPRVTNTASGLQFTVSGLSPISVGWEQPKTPVTPPTPSGGGGGGGSSVSTYAVTIEKSEHGKVTSNRTNASSGSTVTLTVTPDSGYVLDTLTVTDSRGNEIRLTAQGSGKYTFTMPSRAVTVKATFASLPEDTEKPCDGGADCPSHGFTDLGTVGTWYHEAVDYVLRNDLMGGYGNGLFGPNDTLTRAQFAQILFNKEGRPAVTGGGIFTDVAPGAWCAPAITWAAERGIVGGYGNGMFGPNDNITREQLAVMLWRYAGSPAATDKELHFNDADKASGYALDALRWAVENGVINGKGGGILDPKGLATRAQTAQMLKNFLKDE